MHKHQQMQQHLPINGWQDHEDQTFCINISSRPFVSFAQATPSRTQQKQNKKLPFKEHRKCTTKPLLRRCMDPTSLTLDRQLLEKYVERDAMRKTTDQQCNIVMVPCQPIGKQTQAPTFSDIMATLKEKMNTKTDTSDPFIYPKAEKKNRRKYQIKSKFIEQLPQPFEKENQHVQQKSQSRVNSNKMTRQLKYKYLLNQVPLNKKCVPESKNENRKSRQFPAFFRQMTIYQQEQKEKKVKNRTSQLCRRKNTTYLTTHVQKPLNSSLQFTDDNIFPSKRIVKW